MLKNILTKLGLSGIATAAFASATHAATKIGEGADAAKPTGADASLFGSGGLFEKIANTLIYIIGAVAVIMLIIGGLRYVISQGSKEGVTQAKDTILYSVIGIIVAILAYAIVKFVTGAFA